MNLTKYMAVGAITLYLISALMVMGQTPPPNELRDLPPNQTLEREMRGVELHRYHFNLSKYEFLQVRVEQKGVDVTLKLLDSNGNALATMDSPNSKQGPETLSHVAENAGSFALEVRSLDAKAEKGIYSIRREASRVATAKDKRRVEVERLFVAGMTAQGVKGQQDAAIKQLSEAQVGWNELADGYMAELTARQIGQLQIPPEISSILRELGKELETANKLLEQGQELSVRSKSDSLPARTKLIEALAMFRSLNTKVRHNDLTKKIDQSGPTSQQTANYLKGLQLFSKMGEATSLNAIGQTHYNLGELQEHVDFLKRALEAYDTIFKFITDVKISGLNQKTIVLLRATEPGTSTSLAGTLNRLGQTEEALKYLSQALERYRALYKETSDPQFRLQEALTLQQIGTVHTNTSRDRKTGIEALSKAIEIYRTLPDQKLKVATLLALIGAQYSLDFNYEAALKNWDNALEIYRELDDKFGQTNIFQSKGAMYSLLNDKAKVRENFNQVLAILQSPGYAENYKKKHFSFTAGYEVYNELTVSFVECIRLDRVGLAYEMLEDYKKAIEYYEKALALARSNKIPIDIRGELTSIGYNYIKLEKWDKAHEYYTQALEISRAGSTKENVADDLARVGLILLELGKPQDSLKYQDEALALYQSAGVGVKDAFTPRYSPLLNDLGRTHYALGNRRVAIFYGKQGVNAIQDERQRLGNFDVKSQKGFLAKREKQYRQLANWLIEEGRFAQAEQVLAMLKEEEYFDFVRRDSDEIKNLGQRVRLDDKEQKLIARYSLLADRVNVIGQDFLKLDEKKRKLPEGIPLPLDEQKRYEELSAQLTLANAAFNLFLNKQLISELSEKTKKEIEYDRNLQAKLRKWGSGTVALRTVITEDRYRVILTTPTVQVDGKAEIKATDLNNKVFAFRKGLQDPNSDPRPLGKELYDILIKPIEKDLQTAGAKTLVWSLDGTLRYIPLAALSPDRKSYLVEKYQNVIITPKTSDDISDSNAEWKALGVGVSVSQSVANPERPEERLTFSPLPGSKEELLAIVRDERTPAEKRGVLSGRRYLDKDFTAGNLTESLTKETADGTRKYTVVHIASHFRLGGNWSNSFLLLGDGQVLTLEQVINSPEITFGDVELVTLSACNTAFADESNGKEVDSLAEAIQTKHGKAVLATLWSVADESTQLLMSEFYRLRKENPQSTKANALQLAQHAMIGRKLIPSQIKGERRDTSEVDAPPPDYRHPYYWSPFVLIGNWQ